jgi:hypothetical protein
MATRDNSGNSHAERVEAVGVLSVRRRRCGNWRRTDVIEKRAMFIVGDERDQVVPRANILLSSGIPIVARSSRLLDRTDWTVDFAHCTAAARQVWDASSRAARAAKCSAKRTVPPSPSPTVCRGAFVITCVADHIPSTGNLRRHCDRACPDAAPPHSGRGSHDAGRIRCGIRSVHAKNKSVDSGRLLAANAAQGLHALVWT